MKLRDLVLDDVWSFLHPSSQAELRATEIVIAERFNRACEFGCVQYYGTRASSDCAIHFPFDPRNNVDAKAELVVDLRFHTFDVSTTLTNTIIKANSFSHLRARHLTVTGMLHLTAIGDDFLAACDVETVKFDGVADCSSKLETIGDGWLSWCPSLASVYFEGLPSFNLSLIAQ